MHDRILSWVFLCVFFAAGTLRAQAPAVGGAPAVKGGAEIIVAAKVKGTCTKTLPGQAAVQLKAGDPIEQKAKINTSQNSSVVLVFSNGTTTHLEADSEMVIEEFLQDPFDQALQVGSATKEPSQSSTRLALNRGELVGDVKELNYGAGSSFKVITPVGAAGIRGTTFRIVFRPGGTGQAFFTLSTAVGNVAFDSSSTSGGGASGATPGGGTAGPGGAVTGSGTVTGVGVPQGQEISITVNVTTNAQGQMVITAAPTIPSQAAAISQTNLQTVLNVAQDIAVVTSQVTFTPATPPTNTGSQGAPQGTSGTPGTGGTEGTGTGTSGTGGTGGTSGSGGTAGAGGGNASTGTGTQVTIVTPAGTTVTTSTSITSTTPAGVTTTTNFASQPSATSTTTTQSSTSTPAVTITGQIQQTTPPAPTPQRIVPTQP